jgi:hypothetical protein
MFSLFQPLVGWSGLLIKVLLSLTTGNTLYLNTLNPIKFGHGGLSDPLLDALVITN